jgi:hypothetical protein
MGGCYQSHLAHRLAVHQGAHLIDDALVTYCDDQSRVTSFYSTQAEPEALLYNLRQVCCHLGKARSFARAGAEVTLPCLSK